MAILQSWQTFRSVPPIGASGASILEHSRQRKLETRPRNKSVKKKVVQSEREIRGKGRQPHRSCHFAKRSLLSPRQACAGSPLFSLFASARILSPRTLRTNPAEFRPTTCVRRFLILHSWRPHIRGYF